MFVTVHSRGSLINLSIKCAEECFVSAAASRKFSRVFQSVLRLCPQTFPFLNDVSEPFALSINNRRQISLRPWEKAGRAGIRRDRGWGREATRINQIGVADLICKWINPRSACEDHRRGMRGRRGGGGWSLFFRFVSFCQGRGWLWLGLAEFSV